ncbi:MAG: hypothetical protein LBR22_08170 [Desulfovibrio sp.]|jgi:predicted HicB family RNase H-like nuclease|nr:hypothetical protein [Desulfovibrio sp.]
MNTLMTYKGYYGSVKYNADGRRFFGTILGIDDIVGYQCESILEIFDAFKIAVDGYMKQCKTVENEAKVS